MTNKEKIRRVFRSPALRAIVRWSKPVRAAVFLISFLGILASGLSLTLTLVTKNLIDSATGRRVEDLWKYGIMLVAIMVAERVIAVWSAHVRLRASSRFQLELQQAVTRAFMAKEYAAIKPYHSGQLVNRVFSDVSVVKNGVMNLLPQILRIFVSFVGAAVILIMMDWRFVPVMILAGVVGVAITIFFRNPMKRRHKRMQEAEDALHASTQETFENVRLIKASVSEERALAEIDAHREHLMNEQIRNGKLSILMNNGMGGMFDISWMICYLWGCVKIFRGTFTYGSLAALIQLVGRIQSPIANAVSLVSQAYGVVSSAERLMEVIDLPDEEPGMELERFDEIRLENVSFQYDDGHDDVLIDVNLNIRKGDFVALTGISGGGKTSLFQLLLGMYRPTGGRVVFRDGEHEVPACRGTRSLFAYVPQGNTLFSGTLKDNLLMFTDEASDEEVMQAVKAACIEHLVGEIGLDAVLGERGIGLSEGQSQRVAVARALLSGAPILLLDEATSALDDLTEAKMLKNISKMRDKTCIIVTHRRAALDICDYRVHIEDGVARREE